MKKRRRLFVSGFVTISILAFSCNHVYKEYDKSQFPTYSWKYGQEVTFNPAIEDVTKSYKVTLGLRHLYGFPLSSLDVVVKCTSPSGKETTKNYEIIVKDSAGKYLSSCAGDYCDIEVVIEDKFSYEEAGRYKYAVTHNVRADRVPGIMEVGLIVDESE